MRVVNLSDSETPRNTYNKEGGSLMGITQLSDSETTRNTYDKNAEYLPQNSVINTLPIN